MKIIATDSIYVKNSRLEKLDVVRGFTAFYVVLHHLFSQNFTIHGVDLSYVFRFGQEAVIVFFILSGIVVPLSYYKNKEKEKSYYYYIKRRFIRIYLPLLIILLTNYILTPDLLNWKDLTGTLAMLQDLDKKPGNLITPAFKNSPLWSLSYEWWFYLFFFFSQKIKLKFNQNLIVTLFTIAGALSYIYYPNPISRFIMYFSIWWSGKNIADKYLLNQNYIKKIYLADLPLILVSLILLFDNYDYYILNINKFEGLGLSPFIEFRHHIVALFFVLISRFLFFTDLIKKFLNPFKALAPIAYSLYISHWFLIINADYLDNFFSHYHVKYFIYISICFFYCWIVEVKIYPYISKLILKFNSNV
jgi:peptidoglycan/LPS O-acetylase OafA/YrhL